MTGNYKKRKLEFRLLRYGLKDGKVDWNTIIEDVPLRGHRARVTIQPYGWSVMPQYAQIEIFGMNQADMFRFSYSQFGQQVTDAGVYRNAFRVVVYAGDEKAVTAQIYSGQISSAYIDYGKAPEVSFVMNCAADGDLRMLPVAAQSFPGEHKASAIIDALAKANGYTTVNMGLDGVLRDQNLSGPLYSQVHTVVSALDGDSEVSGTEIRYWSRKKPPTGMPIIDVSAENGGLVGYPTFNQYGLTIRVVANPAIRLGQLVKLQTVVPKASGIWQVAQYAHELSDQIPDGPWFTIINVQGVPTASFDSGAIFGD